MQQHPFFDEAPDLAAFLRVAVDIRNIDVEAASRNGILVTQATPGFATSVAELTIRMMLDLARRALRVAVGSADDPAVRPLADRLGPDGLVELLEKLADADYYLDRRVNIPLVVDLAADAVTATSG